MNFILGTLRKNRGEPKIVNTTGDKQHKHNKRDIMGRYNGKVLVFAWWDNRTVRLVTTKQNMVIVKYNQFMGG